jgi:hypothetical protein
MKTLCTVVSQIAYVAYVSRRTCGRHCSSASLWHLLQLETIRPHDTCVTNQSSLALSAHPFVWLSLGDVSAHRTHETSRNCGLEHRRLHLYRHCIAFHIHVPTRSARGTYIKTDKAEEIGLMLIQRVKKK